MQLIIGVEAIRQANSGLKTAAHRSAPGRDENIKLLNRIQGLASFKSGFNVTLAVLKPPSQPSQRQICSSLREYQVCELVLGGTGLSFILVITLATCVSRCPDITRDSSGSFLVFPNHFQGYIGTPIDSKEISGLCLARGAGDLCCKVRRVLQVLRGKPVKH